MAQTSPSSQALPSDKQLDAFRRAVLALNTSIPDDGTSCSLHAAAVVEAVKEPLPRNPSYKSADEPVTRFLDQCLDDMPTAFPDLVASIREIGKSLHWQINPNYRNVFPQHFLENESFAEVIGPEGLLVTPDVRVCLLMMGTVTHYPLHNHVPTELYHVISGTASWRKGEEDWMVNPPGSHIFHDVSVGHEMRTDSEPLLAIASWAGNLSGGEAKPMK